MPLGLEYLINEICAGVEIYYSGRIGGQYIKTAFILCDDYSELVSKYFLISNNPDWSDREGRRYKNYTEVITEVLELMRNRAISHLNNLQVIQENMKQRHNRRNDFFHSTNFLDLSITQRGCVEAFCDLLEYGEILIGNDWRSLLNASPNLSTLETMLLLEKQAFLDPTITPKINRILQDCDRNYNSNRRKGVHETMFPEDLHFRLCVTCGGRELKEKLRALLQVQTNP